MPKDHRDPGPGDARDVLRRVVADHGGHGADAIGRLVFLGEGLTYRTYGATCQLGDEDVALVVRLPRAPEPEQRGRVLQERRLLEHLGRLGLPLRLPMPIAEVPAVHGLAVVQRWVEGGACDLRASRCPSPWELVVEAAAPIHGADRAPLRGVVQGNPGIRADVLDRLETLRGLELPEARDGLAWALGHLPLDEPSRLLHGDLLGHNLLRSPGEPIGVIDWSEACLGDPAYDLAVVTRGNRNPFQVAGGLARLLEAYERTSGRGIGAASVQLHELALCAGFYRADVKAFGERSPAAEDARKKLRSVLERAVKG